jgi:hypothetical protein
MRGVGLVFLGTAFLLILTSSASLASPPMTNLWPLRE